MVVNKKSLALDYHIQKMTSLNIFVCVCVCVWERERETQKTEAKNSDKKWGVLSNKNVGMFMWKLLCHVSVWKQFEGQCQENICELLAHGSPVQACYATCELSIKSKEKERKAKINTTTSRIENLDSDRVQGWLA